MKTISTIQSKVERVSATSVTRSIGVVKTMTMNVCLTVFIENCDRCLDAARIIKSGNSCSFIQNLETYSNSSGKIGQGGTV